MPVSFCQSETDRYTGRVVHDRAGGLCRNLALNRFRDLIYGSHVSIFCDHNPLQYIRECAPKSAKLLRWSLALQEFDIDFNYKKGHQNVVADWLSRCE